ncbi:MAG: hypothetical protein IKZ84_01725, partial [Victivallales bacterium]|nr:hypothetical protein [Victivallales bacterium]
YGLWPKHLGKNRNSLAARICGKAVLFFRRDERDKSDDNQFCYCNWNGAQSRVNLEEWRTPVDAKANEAVTLTNTYEIIVP